MKLLLALVLVLAPMLTSCYPPSLPKDCSDIHKDQSSRTSGVYTIYPISSTSPVQVYCDMDSVGGRWTVFQTRMDGTVNFYRGWDQYKTGFGNASGEYWLGLENIYHLTFNRQCELLVQMEDFQGNHASALYMWFFIEAECEGYRLDVSGFINGGAGDSLSPHNGMRFSTFDRDQDAYGGNCARINLGAFWYKDCHTANPNSVYRWGADGTLYGVGVSWYTWKGLDYSLKTISMKIRPVL